MTGGPDASPATASNGETVAMGAVGWLAELTADHESRLLGRGENDTQAVAATVAGIIGSVRAQGDVALRQLAIEFDGAALDNIEVPRRAWEEALARLEPDVRAALEMARDAIADCHRTQLPTDHETEVSPGVRIARLAQPLRRVGVYAPGGRAAYPSSVLMGVVPARVAGVDEVVVCSPPGSDGRPAQAVLAACALAGADRVFALGGAGAIAAMAHGTASVPRVDKVVGPGNVYVTEAKRQLNGVVAVDCPAGPSEILILADATADPLLVAAELIAQAEHDPDAAAVLVSTDGALIAAVRRELSRLLESQPRAAIVRQALAMRGGLLRARDLDEALRFAERYAPEHMLLLTSNPRGLLGQVRAAGTVFLGPSSSVAFGDYMTGANHVLPTAGLARGYSGLSTLDFLRWTTVQEMSAEAAARLAGPTATLAAAEGLPGHAFAARLRSRGSPSNGRAESAGDPHGSGAITAGAPTELPALRVAYRAIELYDPGRVPTDVDLSDNTNLFGGSPSVGAALAGAAPALLTRYPSVYATQLKQALAIRFGVSADNVTTGCGSDDVIDSAMRAFCDPADGIAYPAPTFGVIPLFARMNGAAPTAVPLGHDFALEAAPLIATRARVTYLCRPNNPTGTLFERAAVETVARGAAGIVLIDEAYADFAGDDMVAFAIASERVVILRTMSKAYGLAGLRVGFAIGPPRLIREIEKSRGPYKVSAIAEVAALAALERDADRIRAGIDEARQNRERLAEALHGLDTRPLPSAANFLLVPIPPARGSASACAAALREHGVAVRAFPGLPGAGDCIRVTVGPWPLMQRFLQAFSHHLDAGEPRP